MRLIIGGHAHGKFDYAKELLPDAFVLEDCIGNVQFDQNQSYSVIVHGIEKMTKSFLTDVNLDANMNIESIAGQFLDQLMNIVNAADDCIITADEIGCGIIPMEKKDRLWREVHGRVLIELAKNAECVERMICGIPQRIK
ncbi:MAG: hypothetical protein E7282_07460 [Lachnospiraceae bacterium]|nr:hypothetical protein [Lachnospiraceae bacterium]